MNFLAELLNKYAQPQPNISGVEDDFSRVSKEAPAGTIADALSASFRSNETPPFAQMAAQLFANSGKGQKAQLLNTLIAMAGPAIIARLGSTAVKQNSELSSSVPEVTPEEAERISPQIVEEVAAASEKEDPSVVDKVSELYAQNSDLIKTLGGAALAIGLAHLAKKHRVM